MDAILRKRVRDQAKDTCEYCRMPQQYDLLPFQVDHIIAEKHHGPTDPENLAWSCCNCNAHKGANIAGLDPADKTLSQLFHPRQHQWTEHFAWHGAVLVGMTAIGRTTIDVLNINDIDRVQIREFLMEAGVEF